jgi:hypothetical protein
VTIIQIKRLSSVLKMDDEIRQLNKLFGEEFVQIGGDEDDPLEWIYGAVTESLKEGEYKKGKPYDWMIEPVLGTPVVPFTAHLFMSVQLLEHYKEEGATAWTLGDW